MTVECPHCLVIGFGAGIGLACFRRFVERGYKASMIARHAERLCCFADDIADTIICAANISDLDGYRATLQKILRE